MQSNGWQHQRAPGGAPAHYKRLHPEQTTLYHQVQQHASSFIAHTEASTGTELPQFIKDEFDAFLECRALAHGFQRPRRGECGHDKQLAQLPQVAGQVELKPKTPWRDGTTHLVMSPLKFMQQPAALVPLPRLHLIRFHAVLFSPKRQAAASGGAAWPCRCWRSICAASRRDHVAESGTCAFAQNCC